jgi:hypothetical protein
VFDRSSRYAGVPVATAVLKDAAGQPRLVRYVRRRPIPPADAVVALASHPVAQNDRIDNVTARYFNDPTQYWRICDANGILRVSELTDPPGRVIVLPLPGVTAP